MLQEVFSLNEQLNAKDFIDIVIEIKEFKESEYDVELSLSETCNEFDKNLRTPIAFTTLEEDEHFDIQVYLDLQTLQIIKEVRGTYGKAMLTHCEYINLENKQGVIDYINTIEFGEMTSLKANVEDLQNALMAITS